MIEPLSPDENARAILSIFRDDGVQAGEPLTAGALYEAFLQNPDHRAEDYAAGLRRALARRLQSLQSNEFHDAG